MELQHELLDVGTGELVLSKVDADGEYFLVVAVEAAARWRKVTDKVLNSVYDSVRPRVDDDNIGEEEDED